jgi:ABC-2 type transport system permease protein
MLAYRLRYFTGVITYLLFVSVHYFIWGAVFSTREPGAIINGFSFPEMVTYVSVAWMARSLYFSNIDNEINELVRTGQISVFLLRPVHFHWMMVCQAAGETLFRVIFFTLPIGIVIVSIFPVSPPVSMSAFLLFLLATAFAFLIFAEISFAIGLLAFSIKSIDGIIRAKYFLVQLLSGLLLPLSFFPDMFERILSFLPFRMIAYVPLQLYLGKIPHAEIGPIVLQQVAWSIALIILCEWMWRRVVSKLTLQGG